MNDLMTRTVKMFFLQAKSERYSLYTKTVSHFLFSLAEELGELEETGGAVQDGDDPFGFAQPAIRSFTGRSRFFFGGSYGRGKRYI